MCASCEVAMAWSKRVLRWLQRLRAQRPLQLVYDEAYRLPVTTLEATTGLDPRRPDLALWYLQDQGWIDPDCVHRPERMSYADLARVHTPQWLQALGHPEPLAAAMGLEAWDIDVDGVMDTLRATCAGTLLAARLALDGHWPVLNLSGGLHHAFPGHGGGLCPVSDLGAALAVLRSEGWRGRVGLLDCDAHPPDGVAACWQALGERLGTATDDTAWIGSLSGSDWGAAPGVDETLLPPQCGDEAYLQQLAALLDRMPAVDLMFVLAGGDVLLGDPLGCLGLTLRGAQRRDQLIAKRLGATKSVWLPGGGYRRDAWQVLANTALALLGVTTRVAPNTDPLARHFAMLSQELDGDRVGQWSLDAEEIEHELGLRPPGSPRLLGFYTAAGIEYAYYQLGILRQVERLGYRNLRVEIYPEQPVDRVRLYGCFAQDPDPHVLMETALELRREPDGHVLFVHWLELRHPKGSWAAGRPALPGQQVPGLGMAREAGELLALTAARMGCIGVVVRPAWFHIAWASRYRFRFRDPSVQGRFEALGRDLRAEPALNQTPGGFQLAAASRAIAAGHVSLRRGAADPVVYAWEAEEMIDPLPDQARATPQNYQAEAARERDAVQFSLTMAPG